MKWTFMVYLAGDNNLEGFCVKDIEEMKKVGSSTYVNIVAQVDTLASKGTQRFRVTNQSNLDDDSIESLSEANTGDPSALIDFVLWAITKYPAEHYALILWNHGSGWKDDDIYRIGDRHNLRDSLTRGKVSNVRSGKLSRALFSSSLEKLVLEAARRAILFDDSAADFLDSQELRRVLQEITPVLNGRLDLLGFDACLMNMIEVVYQVHDLCHVVVGSQEVEPGDGWPYENILRRLVTEPEMSAAKLGANIVDSYVQYYRISHPDLQVTQSAIDANSLTSIASKVSTLGELLRDRIDTHLALGQLFEALRSTQTFRDRDYVDLGDFCTRLHQVCGKSVLGNQAQSIVDALKQDKSLVLAQQFHGKYVSRATGLSIYLPMRNISSLYYDLEFAKRYYWDDFLRSFVG